MATHQQHTEMISPITHRSSEPNQQHINNKDHQRRNDLFKFIEKERPTRLEGKRCFSNNTAVSKDFPEHFQRLNSTERNIPFFSNNPEQIRKNSTTQSFYTHKNYFDVAKQTQQSNNDEFVDDYMKTIDLCPRPFNKKISDYSGYIQQNVSSLWGQTYPLMGFERGKEARKAQHINRDMVIDQKLKTRETFLRSFLTHRTTHQSSFKDKQNRTTKQFIRTNNDLLFGLRTKLRKNRNQIANQLHMQTQSYLIKDTNSIDTLQPYHSTQTYKRNHSSHERPLTGLHKNNKSILSSRTQIFDGLLGKHGQGDRKRHNKCRSSVHNSNIVVETGQQMNKKLEQWQKFNDNKFEPATKIIKDNDKFAKTHKSSQDVKMHRKFTANPVKA